MVLIKQNKLKLWLAALIFTLAPIAFTQSMVANTGTEVVDASNAQVLRNKIINKTLERLKEEVAKAADSQENKRRSTIAELICARLAQCASSEQAATPGCCLYQGDNYLDQVVAIAEKQERVAAAIKYINSVGNIDQKVCDYFQSIFQKLKLGINVPLPDYFHATNGGFASILSSKTIMQSTDGRAGEGTYMSSNNEGDQGYGPYAFAIDSGALADTKAQFFIGRSPANRLGASNVFSSLWAAVLKDIPVAEDSIAFIDTRNNDIAEVKELLAKQSLDIEVVDRETSEEILRIFDQSTEKRELPSFGWEFFNADYYKQMGKQVDMKKCLPENMDVRSVQGVFTAYTFGDSFTSAINKRKAGLYLTGALAALGAAQLVRLKMQKTAFVGV